MKKIIIAIFMFILPLTAAKAIEGVNIGISVMGGVFEANGAKEMFKGAHAGGASPGDVTKSTATDGDTAKGDFVLGSLFIEKTIGDKFAIGFDYVPMSAETETTENIQLDKTTTDTSTSRTNTVQVDFEDLMTIYGTLSFTDNVYAKIGYSEVDAVTNEKLATGGSYGNATLEGYVIGLGYNRDLDSGAFVRVEANYMDFDGVTLTNTADSTKSVSADGFDGYGARISVGKSF
jgi:hypothetical protein